MFADTLSLEMCRFPDYPSSERVASISVSAEVLSFHCVCSVYLALLILVTVMSVVMIKASQFIA